MPSQRQLSKKLDIRMSSKCQLLEENFLALFSFKNPIFEYKIGRGSVAERSDRAQ